MVGGSQMLVVARVGTRIDADGRAAERQRVHLQWKSNLLALSCAIPELFVACFSQSRRQMRDLRRHVNDMSHGMTLLHA
jgi:hypothetical protein